MNDLISAANSALQLVTRLRDINKNIENAEFSSLLAGLTMELSEMKIQLASVQEENDRLKRQLTQSKEAEVEFKGFAYFSKNGDGPFCPGCYDSRTKLIRLAEHSGPFTAFGSHRCPSCDNHFGEASLNPRF